MAKLGITFQQSEQRGSLGLTTQGDWVLSAPKNGQDHDDPESEREAVSVVSMLLLSAIIGIGRYGLRTVLTAQSLLDH